MDYEKMLVRAQEKLPEKVDSSERFEIPKVKGHIQGNSTIISNLPTIADIFNRPMQHILKFLNKELAAKGLIKKEQYLIFNTKLSARRINEKIEEYARRYVLCEDCGKPETKLEKSGETLFLRCNACGMKKALKRTI